MSSLITQAWDEKAINTGTQHMLMNRGLYVGIVQPHNVLKSWQGWPFYLAKSASGQPLGTDIIPVVQACQRWIDMTCQNGHVKTAPKPWAQNARCSWEALWFCKSMFLQDALRLWSTSRVPHQPGVALQPAAWSLWSQVQGWRGLCADSLQRISGKEISGKPQVCYPEVCCPCFTQPKS